MGPVAKHATGPILFAIAAISSYPYLFFNDIDRAALSSSLPRPRTIFTASMHCVGAVSFWVQGIDQFALNRNQTG